MRLNYLFPLLASVAALSDGQQPQHHPQKQQQVVPEESGVVKKDDEVLIHNPDSTSPACSSKEELDLYWDRYHTDARCNRAAFNAYKNGIARKRKHNYFQESKAHSRVPDQQTVVCPAVVHDLTYKGMELGYDTNWIVENKASSPIVLSYLKHGVEYSAVNSQVTPPHKDPQAILMPGEWKHLHTFEGHVFHARQLLPNGNLGMVLLQHRAGLIPVGAAAASNMVCSLEDPEPLVHENNTVETDPAFKRSLRKEERECNQLSLGFRNKAGCPLHGYFVRSSTCKEVFKLHLGTDATTNDFHWDWASPTKFESSYVGHTFVFRSAQDPTMMVDRIDVRATEVVDCPNLQQQATALPIVREILLPVGRQDVLPTLNATNATDTQQQQPQHAHNSMMNSIPIFTLPLLSF